ncbi:MAG: PAS domain S-box protein [Verrucomicrobiota bacterium]
MSDENSPPLPLLDSQVFSQLLRRSSQVLALTLGLCIAVLLGLVLYLLRASEVVAHTDGVMMQTRIIEKQLLSMQSSFRGFRLSADTHYLQGYEDGIDSSGIPTQLDALEELVRDDPSQIALIQDLRQKIRRWFDFVDEELLAVRQDPAQMGNPGFLTRGVPLFDAMMSSLGTLNEVETALRKEQAAFLNRVVVSVLFGFGIAALLGIPALTRWLGQLLRTVSQSYENSLRETAQQAEELQVTLSSIGDAVVATDATGRVDFLNPVAEAILGWTQEEAKGKPLPEVFEIFHEHTRAPAESPVDRVLRENVLVGMSNHTVLRSRHGREIPIEHSAAPIRGKDGTVKGVILVFHDVTEKHQAAQHLKESESRLTFLHQLADEIRPLPDICSIIERSEQMLGRFLNASRCAYASVDPDTGLFSILNDYTDDCPTTVGEYPLSDFGGRVEKKMQSGRTLIIRDVDGELSDSNALQAFRSIGVKAIICCPLHKNGQLRAMMAVHQTIPRQWTESDVSLVESVVERCWTVVERKRAESELVLAMKHAETAAQAAAESAERFQLLGDVISLQVWTATPDGSLDYVNTQCLKYFGTLDESMVLGHSWTQFVHPEDLAGAKESWQRSLATGQRYTVEFRLRGAEHGDFRWFLVRAEAMHDKDGRISKWFGTNTDIHKLKLAQSEAERASRAKDEFLAALSHELRTPLTPVLMTAAALRDDERLPAEVRDQMAMMERNIALEARLIDDLLDLTAISRGKLKLRPEPSDAHSLISLAVEIVRSEAQIRGLTIEQEFAAPLSGLMVDPARFQQVIWNLLRNAVKFTPSGGRIHIQTRDETDADGRTWFSVAVTDTGIGIDPMALEKIFLPFEQSIAAGDHQFGGVGLGLAIARAIVKLHGGRIEARSDGRKLGATFVVEFPDAKEPPSGVAEPVPGITGPEGSAGGPESKALRILLVEDHAATLEALSTLLRRAGHSVITASTVADGLAAAGQGTLDLVVSDLGLPDGTGIQLMEKLREAYQLRGIALSGYGMEDDLARCREAGFVTHLVKPVRFADLRRAIDNIR